MSTRRTNRNQGTTGAASDTPAVQDAALLPTATAQDAPAGPNPVAAVPTGAGGAPEPDDEPNPATTNGDGVDGETGKRTGRIDLKNVKMEPFSGTVPTGAYDTGVRDCAKKSALSIFLTGSARRWLKTYRVENPSATFEATGSALVAKFRPNLTDQEITARIYSEGKRAAETYQEYADRLLQMTLEESTTRPTCSTHWVPSCGWLGHNGRTFCKLTSMGNKTRRQPC
ncbi:hypothetical protein PHMEG_0007753 [Phytophthora megakarya]|uniref:Retrotransposon gag domain-containing protein n=1 Tax=Phytophthora megakarya TaxID=4795 RepID=A0A225WKN5_9STRA|nr:hypothetical protein PHMEG_0007753 [Phytophthora megakarya]